MAPTPKSKKETGKEARQDIVILLTFLDLLADLSMVNRNTMLYFVSCVLQDKALA